jgi:NAD(P)-dependent dehydrogenase (short-subunit alcohol dehydrogenase family)
MLDVNGIAAVVTGGASGLGEGCARKLAANGANVLIADLDEDKGNAIATELGGMFVKADVADGEQMQVAMETAAEMGPLRAAVNAAGVGHAMRTVNRNGDPFDLAQFEFVVRVNLIGTFNCTRLAAAAMSKTEPLTDGERGSIVNFASVAAFDGQIGQAAYSATKAGIVGMTLPIARDLSAIGVRVNTVAPGLFDTPIYDKMAAEGVDAAAFKAKLGESVLFPKRLGFSDELGSMVFELITNSYMNGETIRVDAGVRLPPK